MARFRRDKNQPTVPATIEIEKKTNPFLRCHEQSIIDAASNYVGRRLVNPIEVFATIREWKDSF